MSFKFSSNLGKIMFAVKNISNEKFKIKPGYFSSIYMNLMLIGY